LGKKYKGDTLSRYLSVNKKFDEWLKTNHSRISSVEHSHIQEFLHTHFISLGKATFTAIAAFNARFNEAERKNFHLKSLKKDSIRKKKHISIKNDR
jgi:hypothetical protein